MKKYLFILFFVNCLYSAFSQTPGLIYKPAQGGQSVLDPNLDGYTSETTAGFMNDDEAESEVPYVPLPIVGAGEPFGDLATGPDCGFTDLVKSADDETIYTYSDAVNLLFRFRLGGTADNSKGYTILVDTDQLFGQGEDPDYAPGNPGFEYEITLRTNFGVSIYDIDNNTLTRTEIGDGTVDRPYDDFAQKSIAGSTICGQDYFYDFYVPYADLPFSSSTPVRMVGGTVIKPSGSTGGSLSDIGGIDDGAGITDDLFKDLIDIFPPTSGDDLSNGNPILPRAACPGIDGPIADAATTITGTSTEIDGTIIELFKNGISLGTSVVSGGIWSFTSISPALAVGDEMTATAEVANMKSTSYSNCNPVVVGSTCSTVPTGTNLSCASDRRIVVTALPAGATVNFYNSASGFVGTATGDGLGAYAFSCNGNFNTGNCSQGGNCGTPLSGSYYYTVTETGKCESDPSPLICIGVAGSEAPTISTTPITTNTTTISGTLAATPTGSSLITLVINGVSTATTTTTTNTSWSISGISGLNVGDIVTVSAQESGECSTVSTNSETVQGKSTAPIILGDFCVDAVGSVSEVSGISGEDPGSVITIYTRITSGGAETNTGQTSIVAANGSWTVSGLTISAGTFITATAQTSGELESDFASEKLVNTKTPDPLNALAITSTPINEGDASISGEATVSTSTDLTIQLYIDGTEIDGATATLPQGAIAAISTWTITGLNVPFDKLYAGGVATVTIANPNAGFCESDHSAGVPIDCKLPVSQIFSATTSTTICSDETISFDVDGSENLIVYQLVDQSGNLVGSSVLGNGNPFTVVADGMTSSVTAISLKASKIGISCESTFGSVPVSVEDLTFTSSFINPSDCPSPDGSITLTGASNNQSYDVSYYLDGVSVNTSISSDGSGQIIIPNLGPGNYTDISVTGLATTLVCTSNTISAITLVNSSSPTISLGTVTDPGTCSGIEGSIQIVSSVASVVTYSVNYFDNGVAQSTTLSSDASGNVIIPNLDAGIYSNISITNNGSSCKSNTITTVTLSAPNPTIAIAGKSNPSTCGANGTVNLAFTGIPDGFYTVNYDGGSFSSVNVVSGAATISAPAGSYTNLNITEPVTSCTTDDNPDLILSDPATHTISATKTNPTTCGGNGTIDLTFTGVADGTYTIDYDGGSFTGVSIASNTATINTTASTYNNLSVTISGCVSAEFPDVILSDPTTPTISLASFSNPTSSGGTDGSTSLNFTGVPDGTYTIDYQDAVPSAQTFTSIAVVSGVAAIAGLSQGSYNDITITINGCTSIENIDVTLSDPVVPTITLNSSTGPTTCGGVDGSITLDFTGVADGTYTIDYQDEVPSAQTFTNISVTSGSATITGLSEGIYNDITITTAGGTSIDNVDVTLNDPTPATIFLGTTTNPTTCSGNEGSIQITGLAVGVTYTVNYTDGVGAQAASLTANVSGEITINNLFADAYTNISVTENGCTSNIINGPINLSDPTSPTISLGSNPEICAGENTASLSYSATSGSPNQYSIDFDATAEGQSFNDVNLSALGVSPITIAVPVGAVPGTYNATLTVTNSTTNCVSSANAITVAVGALPSIPTVNSLLTNQSTPTLTGTADSGNTITVAVGGATYITTANGSGDWSIDTSTPSSGTFSPNLNGVNEVQVTASDGTCSNTDATTNELTIDTTAPATPTVDALTTNDPSPVLTGTAEAGSTLTVIINGVTFETTADGSGDWSVNTEVDAPTAGGPFADLVDGNYEVAVTSTDAASNSTSDATNNELTIDTIDPAVPTVDALTTNDPSPVLTGTAETGSTVTVIINGVTFETTADGSGDWSVNTEVDAPTAGGPFADLVDGTYEVAVTSTDAAGNSSVDATNNELTIDTIDPAVPTVDALTTNDPSPGLTGTAEAGSTVTVIINGVTFETTADGSGDWSVNTEVDAPTAGGPFADLVDGNYEVAVTSTDAASNSTSDATNNELTIDTIDPAVPTVDALTTNDPSPVLTGTAEAGSTVTVIINGVTFETTADGSGDWSVNTEVDAPTAGGPFTDLTDGNYEVAVTSTDAAGNSTSDATNNELTVDTVDPAVPTVDALTTNDPSPVLTGTAEAGSTVTVIINGVTFETTADGSGDWSVNTEVDAPTAGGPFADLVDGTYEVAVTSTDAAGNSSVDATNNELTIDTADPVAPTVDALTTNDPSPALTGTAEAGSTVTVIINGVTFETTADGSGDWSVNTEVDAPTAGGPFADLVDGTYEVAVTSTDAAGNSSVDATNNELTIDTADPVAPTVDALTTNDPSPALTGTAEAGSTVTVIINGVTFETTADGSGDWSVNTEVDAPTAGGPFADLVDGNYEVAVTSTDAAGNSTSDATNNELTIDTINPAVPTVDALTTNDPSPVLTGTAEAGSTVTVIINGVTFETTADGSGDWSVNTEVDAPTAGGPFADLVDGTYEVAVTSTDAAGNSSVDATNNEITIDTADPVAPTVDALTTNDPSPVLTGTAETGSTVTVIINGVTFETTADGSGDWSVNTEVDAPTAGGPFADLVDGTYEVAVTSTDAAGNSSVDATNNEITIDTADPVAPTVDALTTNDPSPVLTGTAETGSTVTVIINGVTFETTADGSGDWSVNTEVDAPTAGGPFADLVDGNYEVAVTSTDAAGNSSVDATNNELTIDTIDPAVPTVDALTTNDPSPVLTGTAEAGSTVTVIINGVTFETTADGSGDWSVNTEVDAPTAGGPFADLADGTYDIAVTATNLEGKSSSDLTTDEIVIDTNAPAIPTIDLLASNDPSPMLTGKAEAGSTVTVIINGVSFETTADGSGDWSVDTEVDVPTSGGPFSDLTDGTYDIGVTSTDTAGNSSSDSTIDELTIDTTAPAVPTINNLSTSDPSPVLNGMAEAGTTVSVVINGVTFETSADGSGNWSVNTQTDTPTAGGTFADLADGNYEIEVTSTDAVGNSSTDATTNELTIDSSLPVTPTVDAITTSDPSPELSGTAEAGNTVTIVIDGVTFETTADGSGNWSINTESDTPTAGGPFTALMDGTYDIAVTATNSSGKNASDLTLDEITIDTTAPAIPTIDALAGNDPTPVLTGTAEAGSTVIVIINEVTFETTADGTGNWSVDTETDTPIAGGPFANLPDGTYDISLSSTDGAGNSTSDTTTDELMIDTTAPDIPTVDNLTVSDPLPVLTGTAEAGTTVSVVINGVTFETTADGSGNWSVNTETDTPTAGGPFTNLANGTYEILVTSTDAVGNSTVDATNNELTVLSGDSDGDSIPDMDEDLNRDANPDNDDTDGDGLPNYLDDDDDGDGTPTINEDKDGDGDLFNDDCDDDGIPNFLDADQCSLAVIPMKGFTPDGNGENDFFYIDGIENYPDNNVQIYNRWGNRLFEVNGYNNQDNVWRGESVFGLIPGANEVPEGTYFYLVDLKNNSKPLSGFVVIRK